MSSADLIPGHGGFDPGAVNPISGARECDANLAIALKVQAGLKAHGVGINMSRTTDVACGGATTTYWDVTNQINFANRSGSDIAIAIHYNGSVNPSATGVEVLFSQYPVYDPKEIQLANLVLAEIVAHTGLANRGIKQIDDGSVGVIKKVNKPTILIECAFVSSPGDSVWATDEAHLDIMAAAIVHAVCTYFGIKYIGNGGGAIMNVDQALQVFINKGIITDVTYWKWACTVVKYLDIVFIRVAQALSA